MSKQEEIQKGLGIVTGDEQMAFAVMGYLHSEGVVIKEERELPEWALSGMGSPTENAIYRLAQKDMVGYVAVEPLIKE